MINPLTNKPYIKQKEKCFRCGYSLYDSDVEGYKFVCLKCDENMFSFEGD